MLNTHNLRAQYKRERMQSSRDAAIGGIILAILGGATMALIVWGLCQAIVAMPHAWMCVK